MKKLSVLSACLSPLVALALGGCSQQTVTVQLHPLQQSGDVSYVCRVAPGRPGAGLGVPLSECNPRSVGRGDRDLYALLTQTSTGEIALINVPLDLESPESDEGFVDVDLVTPGYGFLPIGALPGDIVTTPGGFASFVGVGEAGKPGLFGLPTSELSAPSDPEKPRRITDWPACSLPAVPGSIEVVVEPPDADGTVFTSCQHTDAEPADVVGTLAGEAGALGRRKLLVSLPDLGKLVVVDAQTLLERPAGSFQPCVLDGELALDATLPATPEPQVLPDDVATCSGFDPPQPPPPEGFKPTPAGFALAEDGLLYVGDSTAPLVHTVDTKNPCALAEGTPLYPRSVTSASRIVTTSRVAVSPLTPSAKRFVYAIDQFDWPTASVMAFDVSADSMTRAPIVRPGAPFLPFEAPDRIQFNGSPRDLSFLLRDRPEIDPVTGNTVIGERCDPDPCHGKDPPMPQCMGRDQLTPGSLYRTEGDYTTGARATELRGIFASVLLTNGQVAFVDVDDFDAPCRRPASANSEAEEDFRGCKGDPADLPALGSAPPRFATSKGPTVSDEVSCRMVEPHRARSSSLGITSNALGIRAPSLRSFPQFRAPDDAPPGTLAERPKLLGVDFPGAGADAEPVPALVYVGSTLYKRDVDGIGTANDTLNINPGEAERHSVVLPFNEPRSYPSSNDLSLTYEGPITGNLSAGFFTTPEEIVAQGNPLPPGLSLGSLLLKDSTVGYCDAGVNDAALMREQGTQIGVSADELDPFAQAHSDYVVITADFPAETDGYWRLSGLQRADCEATFGKFDDKTLLPTRELSIVDAQQHILSLEPRSTTDTEGRKALVARVRECFPAGNSYLIRASGQWVLRGSATGFRHNVAAQWRKDAGRDFLECVRDCNPRKTFFESRVFEISRDAAANFCVSAAADAAGSPLAVSLDEPAAKCIHSTPTERFAVYRGDAPSFRDMSFSWQTIGGFSTARIDLGVVSSLVSPQAMVGLPEFNWLTVVDASSLGLALLSLDSLSTLTPTLY